MRGFKFSGFVPVRTEVLRYLFELCRHTKNASGPSTAAIVGRWDLGNGVVGAADIDRLCDLLYGESAQSIRQQQLPRNQAPAPVGEQTGQRIRDQDHLRSYADRADQKRTDLARGPFKTDPGPGPAVDGEGEYSAVLCSAVHCIAVSTIDPWHISFDWPIARSLSAPRSVVRL